MTGIPLLVALAGRQKATTRPTLLKASCQVLGDGCVLDLGAVSDGIDSAGPVPRGCAVARF